MEKENFYLLLELSVDPPENDPKIIDEAIKKKQAEWGRLRNHPTKAIQAQQYIGMVSEIHRVMSDDDLREKEAKEAIILAGKRDKEKFSIIDRQFRLFVRNGNIADEEIVKLSKAHSVSEDEIRGRIKKKKTEGFFKPEKKKQLLKKKDKLSADEKIAEIETVIGIRMVKGYITEHEISKLSKRYGIDEDEIRKLIRCPIRKEIKGDIEKPKPLDKSVEKAINENLKIIEKSSLYDFLGLPESSTLETLQRVAKEKRGDILKVGKKTAAVTASGDLAGYCISVFKTEKSRLSYDIGKAIARISEFNSDIDIVEKDGVVFHKYFKALIKNASAFGMDRDEAAEYIESYCNEKQWTVKSYRKVKRILAVSFIVISVIAILVFSSAFLMDILNSRRVKGEYNELLIKIGNTENLEKKEKLLIGFLETLERNTEVYLKAEQKLNEIRDQIKVRDLVREREYNNTVSLAKNFIAEKEYEKAVDTYMLYRNNHPDNKHSGDIDKNVAEIMSLIDDKKFNALTTETKNRGIARLKNYIDYLEQYPKSKHKDTVKKLISDMGDEYYKAITKELGKYEKKQDWTTCIKICNMFLKIYPDDKHSPEVKGLEYFYKKKLSSKSE